MGRIFTTREERRAILAEAREKLEREDEERRRNLRISEGAPSGNTNTDSVLGMRNELDMMPNEETRMVVRRLQAYRVDDLKRIASTYMSNWENAYSTIYSGIGSIAQNVLSKAEVFKVAKNELIHILNGAGAYSEYNALLRIIFAGKVIEQFDIRSDIVDIATSERVSDLLSAIERLYADLVSKDDLDSIDRLIKLFGKNIRKNI